MIKSENSPTLCPRCEHFTKIHGMPGCDLITWDASTADALVRKWMSAQDNEFSWEYQGLCPRFKWNGSTPMYPRYPSGESQGGRMSIQEWLGQLRGSPVRKEIWRIVRDDGEHP